MDLLPLLQALFLPDPARRVITEIVNLCHKIAVAYLRVKQMGWKMNASHLGLSLDDIAFDAIAELFRRDPLGRFVCSRSFPPADFPTLSEADALSRLRAIVIGAVNQQLFRFYGMADPSLARILRNIKLALKDHATATRIQLKGDHAICPRSAESIREHLPPIPPELLAPLLYDRIHARTSLRDSLSALVDVLSTQTEYRRAYGLLDTAMLIRSVQIALYEDKVDEAPPTGLTEEEVQQMVDSVLALLKKNPGDAYLRRGRLSESELGSHLCTVRDVLLGKNGHANAGNDSAYVLLASHLPGLTPRQFNDHHRVILDYLLKLARRELMERWENEA
jgi:hypothetical protein